MAKREFKLEVENGIATVTMNWPESANAIGRDFSPDFGKVLDRIDANPEVRVMILTGAGKVFCGGGDLNEIMSQDVTDMEEEFELVRGYNRLARRLYHFDVPVIAAVNGPAMGGAVALGLVADFAIASERARYDVVFHRIGLSAADLGVPWLLNRAIGPSLASYYVLTGGSIDAATGHRLGLFAEVVPAENLMAAARAAAKKIADAPKPAVRISKVSLRRGVNMDLDSNLEIEAYLQSYAFRTEEHKKRVGELRAFIARKGK
ncbi:MAG: enoyl-CoA hydratase/isomerase family protein [Roseiarcus sp.]